MPSGTDHTYIRVSSDPAANVEISYTADIDMIVKSLSFVLVCDANVANRIVNLKAADPDGNIFYYEPSPLAQTAGLTFRYNAINGLAHNQMTGNIADGKTRIAFPGQGLWLPKNWVLSTTTTSRQVGDNFSAMTMQVEAFE